MDLIDRYLAAVRQHLPDDKAEDIVAELGDELASRREARQEALGHPLSPAEESAMLKSLGHPLVIANRYRPRQYLIGPEIFPFYLFALRIVLMAGTALVAAVAMASTILGDGDIVRMVARAVHGLWQFFFTSAALVTLGFALYEGFGGPIDYLRRWTPEQLPDVLAPRKSQWEAALEAGASIAFLLWWTGTLDMPQMSAPRGMILTPAPIWEAYHLPILLLGIGHLAVSLFHWLRPGLRRANHLLTLLISLATIGVLAGLYRAGVWVTISSATHSTDLAELTQHVNLSVQITIAVAVAIMAWQAVDAAWKLARPAAGR